MYDGKSPDNRSLESALFELRTSQLELEAQNEALREAHDALGESRSRYLRLFELAPVGFMVLDREAVIRRTNRLGATLLGLTPHTAEGQPLLAFVVPEHQPPLLTCIATALVSGHREAVEFDFAGRPLTRSIRGEFVALRDEEPGQVLVALVDVSEHREATLALLDSEERYRHLFDASRDALLLVRPGGRIVEANRAAGELFGQPPDTLGGRSADELFERPDRFAAALNLANERDDTPRVAHVRALDGRRTPVEISFAPVVLDGPPLILVSMRDITDRLAADHRRRTLEGKLHEAHRLEALGTLAGGVAHDMNNLLTVISSIASVMWEELGTGTPPGEPPADAETKAPAYADDITDILQACRRGQELTRNLLGFARKSAFVRRRVALVEIVDEVVRLVRRTISKDLLLHIDVAPDLEIAADRTNLSRALMNLCLNAHDATSGRGRIDIYTAVVDRPPEMPAEVEATGPFVELVVRDDGIGMDPATVARAFEPFYTTKDPGQGTGLGLSMVYGTARSHDGWARIESVPGDGTKVIVYLPLLAAHDGPRTRDSRAMVPIRDRRNSGTVLLVDDEPIVRRSTARILETLGFAVLVAESGEEALELYRTRGGEVDIALLDIIMPGMDGYQVHDALRQLDADLPILLYSGYADRERRGQNRTFDDLTGFLAKPFTLSQLERQLDGLLATGRKVAAMPPR